MPDPDAPGLPPIDDSPPGDPHPEGPKPGGLRPPMSVMVSVADRHWIDGLRTQYLQRQCAALHVRRG